MQKTRIIIMGAGGRDFHNFNVKFRDNPQFEVVAFTATQIPGIEDRKYPPELSGSLYPEGVPIYPEENLPSLIRDLKIDQTILAYSDLSYQEVMEKGSLVLASGADFCLLGPESTMLETKIPVIAVCAVRTGSGKSQTSRKIGKLLREMGYRVAVIRHPMPYGNLSEQKVQRFVTKEDLNRHDCTIEEREEYEPHLENNVIVFAGVDYGAILKEAEKEADAILWDGGNNDFPFYKPKLFIVVADPHRAGHEKSYYPGSINAQMADVVVINKVDTAKSASIEKVRTNIKQLNPTATILETESPIFVDDPSLIKDRRVLVIEDGPTLTHGQMTFGAGMLAAQQFGAKEIIDPFPYLIGSLRDTYEKYPHLKGSKVLPAMGYGDEQMKELRETIHASDSESVVIGTPIDLSRLLEIDRPSTRVRYETKERQGSVSIETILNQFGFVKKES